MCIECKFKPGGMYVTAVVNDRMKRDINFKSWLLLTAIPKYLLCDWSEMSEEDQAMNEEAVYNNLRIFASYTYPEDNTTIWIITEADRSITTILFPEDY